MKANREGQYYYTRERIDLCASLIIMMVIIALLVIPIFLLYKIVSENGTDDGFLSQHRSSSCIGVLLAFSLLFSAVLWLFTKARRHEILGAAAA